MLLGRLLLGDPPQSLGGRLRGVGAGGAGGAGVGAAAEIVESPSKTQNGLPILEARFICRGGAI